MRFLVTGATGAIGVPLVNDLLANGHTVSVLIRQKANRTHADVLRLFDKSFAGTGRLSVIDGDVRHKMCGVSQKDIRLNIESFDALIHSAGDVQYYEHLRAETFAANEGGTRNALELATVLEINRFVFVSTAYVAGKKLHFGENELGSPTECHNPYEESKIAAEALVRRFYGEHAILRLGTVIGHGESGQIVNVGGYAAFVKGFHVLRSRIAKYPDNPFYVGLNPASTLNLVTSDWTVAMIRSAAASEVTGTFHLTHPNPVNMGWLFQETFAKRLKLPLTFEHSMLQHTTLVGRDPVWEETQSKIDGIVEYFAPYVNRDTVFAHERVKTIPGYEAPRAVDGVVIQAQMDYMLEYLFAKKKLKAVAAA